MRRVAYVVAFFVSGTVGLLVAILVAVLGQSVELVRPALLVVALPLQVLSLLGVWLWQRRTAPGEDPRSLQGTPERR